MKISNLYTIVVLLARCYENEALSTSSISSSKVISPLFRNAINNHFDKELNPSWSSSSSISVSGGTFSRSNNANILSNSPLFNSLSHVNVKKQRNNMHMKASTSSAVPDSNSSSSSSAKKSNRATRSELRKEGGIFSFDTPIGALNIYGLVYGLTAIGLGLVWYAITMFWKLIHFISGKRFDKMHRIPIFVAHCWGRALMNLTLADPKIENRDILEKFYKEGRAAMVVANHNSWQDIPYLGTTIGWRNYKIIAKKELLKVPILGNGISAGGHVVIDRTNRRSQLMTLKSGIEWLKNGVMLCAFPEGTRSKDGKLLPFKSGAFKMAFKAGAPVIPLSICGAAKVQPVNWMFPLKRAWKDVKVIVHEPVESVGRTEAELAEIVREKIISGLPEDQRP